MRSFTCIGLIFILALPASGEPHKKKGNRDQWQQPARTVKDLGLKPGDRVADIGCGSGYFTFRMAKEVGPDGRIYAEDIQDKPLTALKNRMTKEGVKNIEVIKGDPDDIKIKDTSCDAAIIVNVLHHVPKEGRLPLVQDTARVIKPGGNLFVIDWREDAEIKHDKHQRIPRDELLDLFEQSGLTLDAEFYYLKNQVFLRCRKNPGSQK